LTMRRDARVEALSVIGEGTAIGGCCTFDGDRDSPGIALSVTSASAFVATTN
ncbi:hypothetical protein A2U01_0086283, partial [Trifolium medium]|nr:hypothetical protein [Trifolium medium]